MALFDDLQQNRDLSLLNDEEQAFFQRWVQPLEVRIQELEQETRERSPEARFLQVAQRSRSNRGIPQAQRFQVVSSSQDVGVTHAVLSWTQSRDPNILGYEIWVSGLTEGVEEPTFLREATKAPAAIQLTADGDVTATVYLVPRLLNGLPLDPSNGATVTIGITQNPAGVGPGSITSLELADGAVGDAKLDRTTDPIVVTNADIANATIQSAKIANLDAAKINAGILAAGVILTENIAATQVNAGTLNSVNVNAGTYNLISGNHTMGINGTDGFVSTDTGVSRKAQILNGGITVSPIGSGSEWELLQNSITGTNSSGGTQIFFDNATTPILDMNYGSGAFTTSGVELTATSTGGRLRLYNSSGSEKIDMRDGVIELGSVSAPSGASGQGHIWFDSGTNKLRGRDATGSAYDLDSAGAGGSPGGSNTHVQYNDSGSFGGESGFTYNDLTNTLSVQSITTTGFCSFGAGAEVDNDLDVGDEIRVYGGSVTGNYRIKLEGGTGSSGNELTIRNSSGTNKVELGVVDSGADSVLTLKGDSDVILATSSVGPGLYIAGNKIVSSRLSSISSPAGGATVDSEARTAINTIISRLETHGLISP